MKVRNDYYGDGNNIMKVVFGAGGTGGHLYPAIAIADKLKASNIDVLFLISNNGMDKSILESAGYSNFIEQKVSGFMGKSIFDKIRSIFSLIGSVKDIYKYVSKGDKVIVMGGFVSAPVAVLAKLKGVDLYLHEQNKVMGLVNTVFARMSKKVFLSFTLLNKSFKRSVLTGNPVRDIFYNISTKTKYSSTILVFGGSQGSKIINKTIIGSIDELLKKDRKIIHITGRKLYDECINLYGDKLDKYKNILSILSYADNISDYISDADIIISRAGSGSIFEIVSSRRIGLFIPFKLSAKNHQYHNAKDVVDKGIGVMLEEDLLNCESLNRTIIEIEDNYISYMNEINKEKVIHSADIIVSEVLN